jgi:hypothetical protein
LQEGSQSLFYTPFTVLNSVFGSTAPAQVYDAAPSDKPSANSSQCWVVSVLSSGFAADTYKNHLKVKPDLRNLFKRIQLKGKKV